MAYNLFVEFNSDVEWIALHAALGAPLHYVETFPIPEDTSYPSKALGLSIPRKAATPAGVSELRGCLSVLRQFGGRVFVLYSGAEVIDSNQEEIEREILG